MRTNFKVRAAPSPRLANRPGLRFLSEPAPCRRAIVQEYTDKVLKCVDCGSDFIFTAGEQLFFADKGLKNEPKRCKPCKSRKNERIAANMQTYGTAFPRERVEVTVKCALCAIETTVPFRPTQGRPVYCRDCFLKMRASVSHPVATLP
jgi:CxxC-x17-CxxC domain-containing protein